MECRTLYVKTSYLFLLNERELHVTENIMQFLTNYEVGSGFFYVLASFAGLIQMIAIAAPIPARILVT